MRLRLSMLLLVFCIFFLSTSVQSQDAACQTLDQCRLLVDVVRVQLKQAQDMWAFWADQAAIARGQFEQEKKKQSDVSKPEEKVNETPRTD